MKNASSGLYCAKSKKKRFLHVRTVQNRSSGPRKSGKTDFKRGNSRIFGSFSGKKKPNHQLFHYTALENTYPIDSGYVLPDLNSTMNSNRTKLKHFVHFPAQTLHCPHPPTMASFQTLTADGLPSPEIEHFDLRTP